MTREQALEKALRAFKAKSSDAPLITLAEQALALPPDTVNADMLAALQSSKGTWDDLRRWIGAAIVNQSLDWQGLRSFMDAAGAHSTTHSAAIARATA